MRGVTFAATHRWVSTRAQGGWRGVRRSAPGCALAFGLVLAFVSASAAADPTGLEREIREAREIAAEVSRAVHRVQTENLKLRSTLGSEVQNLNVEDVTATMLRLGRLDADTARLYVITLENRIANAEAALRLLEEDFERRAADLEGAPAAALETLGAQAELQQLWEMRTVRVDLIDGLRNLRDAESERLALAEEHLALLSSRADLRAIHQDERFDRDPRAVALRAIISRLSHDALRLDNEAGTARPKSQPDPARKSLLQLQSGDAIIRSTVRVGDLELIRAENQLEFYENLWRDDSIPVAVLREARAELDDQRARLDDRLAALAGDRLTLEGQRELIRAQAADSADAGASLLGPVEDLSELLDAQQADVTRLQQRLEEVAAQLDDEIGQRAVGALRERRALPINVGHWNLVKGELIRLPQMAVVYWRGIFSDVADRLVALPARALAGLAAAILVAFGALWWLYRTGLERMAMLSAAGKASAPLEALRRSLPLFAPVVIWIAIARTVGVAERPAWLLAQALGLLPLAGFLLHLRILLFAAASAPGAPRRRLHSTTRWAVLAAVATAALGLVLRSVPVLPSVSDLIDRAGFGGLLLTAVAIWLLRQDLLYSVQDQIVTSRTSRLVASASHVIPGLMVVAAVSGLAGWINFGWALARAVALFVLAAGVALLLCSFLRDLASALERRFAGSATKGSPGAAQMIEAGYRLAVTGIVVGVAWLLARYYLRGATQTRAFWIIAVAGALPFVLQPVQTLIASFLHIDPERRPDGSISIPAICVDRGIRALLVIGTVLALVWALDFDLVALATSDTLLTRIVRGVFNIAVVVLVADFVWHLSKTAIDSRLQTTEELGPIETDEARRRARLRTLLPILRNVLLTLIAVTAVLMALSSMGVQIGPLLAGAGVVGIAVGFGAQTLVRDIFAGVFYLLDDAFRVGEYIQSGNYKGTVEAFSLRSVKIRHHRGSLFTVPFGELGAVQNMSRDWVIDKLSVSVPYDTDLAKVKKVIKEVSKELMAEPELAANVIEPLKMQGVEQFGDFAIEIRMKMMTKPGEQFVIRRRAYALIKQAFNANGIEFASPTVTVAGGGEASAAAAQQALKLVQPEPAAAQPAG
jgi:small-conductance mechanosensitive channel